MARADFGFSLRPKRCEECSKTTRNRGCPVTKTVLCKECFDKHLGFCFTCRERRGPPSSAATSRTGSNEQLALANFNQDAVSAFDENEDEPLALQDQGVSVKDLESMISKAIETNRRNLVADSLTHIRDAMKPAKPDLATRMGVMTGSKICEVQRILVEEMEESVKLKLSYICCVFHCWRAETGIHRIEQGHHENLKTKQDEWEAYCEEQKARFANDADAARRHADMSTERWRQATALMLDQWAHGEAAGTYDRVWTSWRNYTEYMIKRRKQEKRLQQVARIGHGMVLKWLEGSDKGSMHTSFLSWLKLVAKAKAERETRSKMEDMLSDQRQKHAGELEDTRTELEKQRDQQKAVVGYALARWELGDDGALASKLVGAWKEWTAAEKRLAKKRQSVHLAMMKALEGDARGIMHAAFMNWHAWQKHEVLIREGDARLADEKTRWESLLEDKSKNHEDGINDMMTEAERQKARAHEAMTLMMRQWFKGDEAGILSTVIYEWKKLTDAIVADSRRRQQVHAGVLRFLEGDKQAMLHLCILNWKEYTKVQLVYKNKVAEQDRAINQLQEKAKHVLGHQQARTLKYMRMLFAADDAALQLLVLSRWRMESHGLRGAEERRELEVELQEQMRLHDIAMTKHKELIAATYHVMSGKDGVAMLMEYFLAWSFVYKKDKQEWAHKLNHDKCIQKFAKHTLGQLMHGNDANLLASVFWELVRECKQAKHTREREEAKKDHENVLKQIHEMKEEKTSISNELELAYREIDRLTDEVHAELRAKEKLAKDLDQAHKEMRRSRIYKTDSTAATTPTSETRTPFSRPQRELPHLPRRNNDLE